MLPKDPLKVIEYRQKLSLIAKKRFSIPENNTMFGVHRYGDKAPSWKGGEERFPNCKVCNKRLSRVDAKYCIKHVKRIGVSRPGILNPNYGNRYAKKYYCKNCLKEISKFSKGLCGSCSKKQLYIIPQNNPNWKGGISFVPYPLGWNHTFKEQIRYRDGYKCQICGMPEIENGRKLSVHHKDYNKDNINEKNLISLCIKCHIKTNYKREYWLEYFHVGAN